MCVDRDRERQTQLDSECKDREKEFSHQTKTPRRRRATRKRVCEYVHLRMVQVTLLLFAKLRQNPRWDAISKKNHHGRILGSSHKRDAWKSDYRAHHTITSILATADTPNTPHTLHTDTPPPRFVCTHMGDTDVLSTTSPIRSRVASTSHASPAVPASISCIYRVQDRYRCEQTCRLCISHLVTIAAKKPVAMAREGDGYLRSKPHKMPMSQTADTSDNQKLLGVRQHITPCAFSAPIAWNARVRQHWSSRRLHKS